MPSRFYIHCRSNACQYSCCHSLRTKGWENVGCWPQIAVLVAQSCPTLGDPMDCSPQCSSVHEIQQARILKWVAIPFSRGSSWPKDRIWVSCIAGRFFTIWATREVLGIHYVSKSGRPSRSHRTGILSSQFSRRVVPKNALTIRQLHSFPMLVRSCLKPCMLGFSIMWTKNFQMSKLGLKKEEELKIKFSGL